MATRGHACFARLKKKMKQFITKGFKTLSALALGLSAALAAPIAEAATPRVASSATMVQGTDIIFDLATVFPTSGFQYAISPLYQYDAVQSKYVTADANLFTLIDTNGDTNFDSLQVLMSHDASYTGSQPMRIGGVSGGDLLVMDLDLSVTPNAVPEPSSALLALLGLSAVLIQSRRRSR